MSNLTATQQIDTVAGESGAPVGEYDSGSHEVRTRRQQRRAFWLLSTPGLIGLAISFVAPVLWMVRMAFNRGSNDGFVEQTFTLDMFIEPLSDPYYWKVIGDTFVLGITVAIICTILSYPIALFLARTTNRYKSLLVVLAIAPLLTSIVVRSYGWAVLLGGGGLINSTLQDLGLITAPLKLSNNWTGVIIGLVEILMPFAILTMLSGFGRLNPQLEEAASSLGASRLKVFLRVILPLSLPGVLAAVMLAFVQAIGSFVTPRILGGGNVQVLATEIYDQATGLINWPFAAALSVILLVLFGLVIAIYQLLLKRLGVK